MSKATDTEEVVLSHHGPFKGEGRLHHEGRLLLKTDTHMKAARTFQQHWTKISTESAAHRGWRLNPESEATDAEAADTEAGVCSSGILFQWASFLGQELTLRKIAICCSNLGWNGGIVTCLGSLERHTSCTNAKKVENSSC